MLDHPVLIQLVVILGTAKLVGLLLSRFGQPSVVSEMFAGLLLGPGICGALFPEIHGQLFAAGSLAGLEGLVQVGVVLFMFIVGLEMRAPSGPKTMMVPVVSIGTISVLLPLLLGAAISPLLFHRFAPPGVSFFAFACFIAVAFSITAFPVLARILKDRAIAHTDLGQLALSSAAFSDLLAWVMVGLVVIVASAHGSWTSAVELLAGLTLLVAVLFGLVRPLVARMLPPNGKPSNEIFTIIVIGVFIAAYVTKRIHIDAVFGAFLFGLCLPRDERLVQWFSERVEPVAVVVLMPVFFALAGLKTSAGAFGDETLWVFALIFVTAVAGKIAGGFIGARIGGCAPRMAMSIGALMNARGLMEMIVLKIGLDAGLIGADLFTMFLVMAIATTVMAGPLLSLIERRPAAVGLVPAEN